MKKVNAVLSRKNPKKSARDLDQLFTEILNKLTYLGSQGRLEVEKDWTGYFITACQNKLIDQARLKKGHETLFSTMDQSGGPNKNRPTDILMVETLAAPGRRPDDIVIGSPYPRKQVLS